MLSDQISCSGDMIEGRRERESGLLTYLNLRCDDTRKVSIEQIIKYVKGRKVFKKGTISETFTDYVLNQFLNNSDTGQIDTFLREEDSPRNEKEDWERMFDKLFIIVTSSVFLVCVVGLFWARNSK